jgi:hypothetical protein
MVGRPLPTTMFSASLGTTCWTGRSSSRPALGLAGAVGCGRAPTRGPAPPRRADDADEEVTGRRGESLGRHVDGGLRIDPVVAAIVLGEAKDVARFRDRDHFAAYNGTAMVGVSSKNGKVHRLSRRGTGGLTTHGLLGADASRNGAELFIASRAPPLVRPGPCKFTVSSRLPGAAPSGVIAVHLIGSAPSTLKDSSNCGLTTCPQFCNQGRSCAQCGEPTQA